nr:metalloprotease PmbA [Gammaproteobacteria bacterium]
MADSALGDPSALEPMIERVLDIARQNGASAAEATVAQGLGYSVSVRMGDVETVEHQQDKGLSVTVYVGQQKGSANTTDFRPDAIEETVRSACTIASFAGSDDCAGLADADKLAKNIPDLDLYHPWTLEPAEAVDLALAAETTARDCDARITNSEGASVSVREGMRAYGNSAGFFGGYRTSRHSQSCVVIAQDDAGMQRDYWYSASRVPNELESPESIGQKAGERAVRRLGARQLGTLTVPVLYAAEIASGLVGHFVGAISGGNLYRQASFLLDQLGEQVFPTGFWLGEDPLKPRAAGSAPFDSEGVQTRARDIVADGRLEGYVLSSYSARKLGTETTGNAGGVRNVVVRPTSGDQQSLIKSMDRGVLVTELIGMGVNLVTGDYSRGAAGFWVENGQI